jgi:hypothetical protein
MPVKVKPLLYTRKETAALLNCSEATLLRLEKLGRLTPHKLNPSPLGKTFYSSVQIHALAGGGDDAS